MLDSLRQDLAYALRRLRQAPGFTLVAVATLALGIGATSAIFSVVNAVLLHPLPFPESDRLVLVAQTWEGRPVVYSPPNFLDVEALSRSIAAFAAIDRPWHTDATTGMALTGQGTATTVEGASVSARFFDVLRVRPVIGRGFLLGENEPGRTRVAVIGYRLWRDRFGSDPAAVGRTVHLDRQAYEVVGVAPDGFSYPERTEVWTPLEYDQLFRSDNRGAWYLTVIGRLAEGATVDGAREEVATIAARLARAHPDQNENVGGTVLPLREALTGDVRRALLVLLVACVNVASLLLSRLAGREGEMAVRAALGAGRGRLLRQLLTESLLLAVLGGVAGVVVATVVQDALLALQPRGVPRLAEVRIDRAVVGFAAGLSLLTAALCGALPAVQASRRATAQALRQGGRAVLSSRGGLRGGLVVGQVALAMVLLAGSSLLIRSVALLRRVDPGFRPQGVPAQQPTIEARMATPDYFRTMGIPLRRGRGFEKSDGPGAPPVALLSEAAVRRFFPGEEPIGKRIRLGLGRGPGTPRAGGEVVGVVGDVKERGLAEDDPPEIYIPYAQFPIQSIAVVVRADVRPRSLVPAVERLVHALDPDLPVTRTLTLEEVVAQSVSDTRFYTLLLSSFAATALFLAALGLFGVTSYAVAQRTRELAVRVALGARREELLLMVLREALLLGAAGVAVGLAGAVLLSRVISSMLYSLSPRDPLTLGGVALLLLATTLLAGYLPARRATRVDPVIALRAE